MATAPAEPAAPLASPFHEALLELCRERGFAQLTVAQLCRRAGLAPAAFHRHHADLGECLAGACAVELEALGRAVATAQAGLGPWRERLRAGAYALYRRLWANQRRRHLLLIEARAAGGRPELLLEAGIEALIEQIDEGRAEPGAPPSMTRATAASLGGAIFTQAFIAAGRGRELPAEGELVPITIYTLLLPYLGPEEASAELGRDPPPPATASPPPATA